MCFKKPKAPPKSAEDIALEKDLAAQREARKRELAVGLADEKKDRTEMDVARALGLFGFRSLIGGPRGGAGFLGAYGGRFTGATGSSLLARSRKRSSGGGGRSGGSGGGGSSGGGYTTPSYGGGYGGGFGGGERATQDR